jgi:membrane protease YdiL (CAAX protease family)
VTTGKLAGWLALVGTLSTLNYASRLASGKPPRDELYRYGTAVSALFLYAIVLALVVWIARGLPARELGLRRPRSWPGALGLTLGVFVAIVIVELALEPLLHASREQGLEPTRWEPSRAVPFALNAAVVVLAAPFVEELTFRGLGFALLSRYGPAAAVLGSAVAFGLAHGLIAGFVALAVFGLFVAILRLRTDSLYPGMLLHACFNGFALADAFAR